MAGRVGFHSIKQDSMNAKQKAALKIIEKLAEEFVRELENAIQDEDVKTQVQFDFYFGFLPKIKALSHIACK
jgi:hypothetical protein